MELYRLSRMKIENMIEDVTKYTRSVYNQSKTVYSAASPYGQLILVLQRIAQMIMTYIEDVAQEQSMRTATRPSSIYALAAQAGHTPTRAIAATGEIYIVYNGKDLDISGDNIIIQNFTSVRCRENGLKYLLSIGQDELRINTNEPRKRIFVRVIQGELESMQFTGTGTELQSFPVNVPITKNIDNFFVNVFVNGEKWVRYDSLWDIPREVNGFLVKPGLTTGVDIVFGRGSFGKMPPLGSIITCEYLITNGENGNINEFRGASFEFDDPGYDKDGSEIDLNAAFNIGITSPISLGSNPEPLFLTRLMSPHTSRSFVLANTQNYIHFFEMYQAFSTIKAETRYVETDPYVDNIIYLLLVPDIRKRMRSGENYFTVPLEMFSLTELEKGRIIQLLDESGRKIVTAVVELVDPQFKRYAINIDLATWEGYSKDTIRETIVSRLSEFFLSMKRKDFIPKSDIVAILESIDGVDSVKGVTFVSEDIEKFLDHIATHGLSSEVARFYKVDLDIDATTLPDGTPMKTAFQNATHDERVDMMMGLPSVRTFMGYHVDDFGDIVIGSDQISIIRGDWSDRYNNYVADSLSKSRNSMVNINFIKTRTKDAREDMNKATIQILRGDS